MTHLNNREQEPTYLASAIDLNGASCAVCNRPPKKTDGSDAASVLFPHPSRLVCEFCIRAINRCMTKALTL